MNSIEICGKNNLEFWASKISFQGNKHVSLSNKNHFFLKTFALKYISLTILLRLQYRLMLLHVPSILQVVTMSPSALELASHVYVLTLPSRVLPGETVARSICRGSPQSAVSQRFQLIST